MHFNREVAEYIGRSVVIIVLFIILCTRTCAGTFTYTLWYTSTLVPKKNFERAGHAPLLGTYTYVVLEPLEAPHVPSKRTSSLNRERYAMAVWGNGQNFPLRESYPQCYLPHCSPPEVVTCYWLCRTRTWWWTGPVCTG